MDWLHEVKTLIICGDSAVTPNVEFYHNSPFMTETLANNKVTNGNPGTEAGSGRKTKLVLIKMLYVLWTKRWNDGTPASD